MKPSPALESMPHRISAKDRMIVALDVSGVDEAQALITPLDGVVSFFKIGLQFQLSVGLPFVRELIEKGNRIFLDYKYFDIEETIQRAVSQVAAMGVSFLTIHGNGPTVRAAVEGRGDSDLKLLSVTVLTSLDSVDIQDLGFTCDVEQLVLYRARKALEAGCDGVIASGREVPAIRELAGKRPLLIVTPGIRRESAGPDDHKRAVTPSEAIKAGADYLVVGRPIRTAPDPRKAAEEILEEMQEAFDEVSR
jgi:orotidine-5'-phosphate decarboxylase